MPGLLRGLARTAMVAGTATAVSNRVSRRQAGRWAARDDQQQAAPQQAAPQQQAAAPQGGEDPVIAQLKDLADLKAQGVLSEEEFEVQKRRVLGG